MEKTERRVMERSTDPLEWNRLTIAHGATINRDTQKQRGERCPVCVWGAGAHAHARQRAGSP